MRLNIILFLSVLATAAVATFLLNNMNSCTLRTSNVETASAPSAKSVPNFQFTDTNGKTHDIDDFKGQTVILNFWASWCTPCLKEFPEFIQTANTHPDDVTIIALSSDFKPEAMNRFLDKMKKKYPKTFPASNMLIALDTDGDITQNLFQTHRLPETIVIDKNGNMVEKIVGANWDASDLSAKIEKLKLSP